MIRNNEFIAQSSFVPKTETRIVLEQKEPNKLIKLASSLGIISTSYACNEKNSEGLCPCEVRIRRIKAASEAASEMARKTGGKVELKVGKNGDVSITYTPPKKN